MASVKRMTVAGFRGILAPFRISFAKNGGGCTSLILYGRNGTGKSSITDAWEWFRTLRIEHLAREGAREGAYPHVGAQDDETFVEVEFASPTLGTVRVQFDHSRITKPNVTGNHAAFCELTPHPCHVRFTDLTRFVYLTKADRYDALAQLMGFQPQVEYQKALRRVQKTLEDDRAQAWQTCAGLRDDLQQALANDDLTDQGILSVLSPLFEAHGINPPSERHYSTTALDALKELVERDPTALRLAELRLATGELAHVLPSSTLEDALQHYLEAAVPFKDQEGTLKKILFIGLYERAQDVLSRVDTAGACPLCGQQFSGNLKDHVARELDALTTLQTLYRRVRALRSEALKQLESEAYDPTSLQGAARQLGPGPAGDALLEVLGGIPELLATIAALKQLIQCTPEDLDGPIIEELRTVAGRYSRIRTDVAAMITSANERISEETAQLQSDEKRRQLVDDYQRAKTAIEVWQKLRNATKSADQVVRVYDDFTALVTEFVEASLADVQQRFDLISENVTTYFDVLEEHTHGIGKPVLRLLPDQDRAVVPEVSFHGQTVAPAYRYLSESQLNSFGLAVFLASARQFNPNFRFILLDDVVNSLDGYKRPQLIKLLKDCFSDYQILLLTHDSAWRDRIYRECPGWKRLNFVRHDFGTGPIVREGSATLEEVEHLILEDKPRQAGQVLGPYLEGELQEVAEAFEAEVKYNRRNEYTLDPLLDRVRLRVEKKLSSKHLLAGLLQRLQKEAGFRNICAHAKDPEIDLTPEEMNAVVQLWQEIQALVRCPDDACGQVLRYADGDFRCPCGRSILSKAPKSMKGSVAAPSSTSSGDSPTPEGSGAGT